MNGNLHELVFILDQSSEIEEQYDDAQKGFKALISAQKKSSADTHVTVNVFGGEYVTVCDGVPINKADFKTALPPLSGVCPLTDSAVKAIDDVGIRLNRTYEGCRPSKVIVTLVAFGRDNASKKHTYNDLAEIIKHQTEVYKWSFFLLTDFSINMEKLNIPEDNTVIVKKNEKDGFTKAYSELNEKITALRNKTMSDTNSF